MRVSNKLFVGKGGPFSTRGGIRLGGSVDVKEEVAREEAVKVAQGADGEFQRLRRAEHHVVDDGVCLFSGDRRCWLDP